MPQNNPYGCHSQALTPSAKKTMLAQSNGRLAKFVTPITLDRGFLEQMRENNPHMTMVYRHFFGDNNLADVDGRAQAIIKAVKPVADLINVVETGFNECCEGINDGIADLARAEIEIADRIHQTLPGMMVGGGCFSVGTPYNNVLKGQFQDIEAYSPAFEHLDFWMPHEYGEPNLMDGCYKPDGHRLYGDMILRYRWIVDWAKRQGVRLPPIILGEFGLDFGGGGQGFRSHGISVDQYMNQAKMMAPYLLADILAGILVGAVFFCVGQLDPDRWQSFDLAGESAFVDLLNTEFDPAAVWKMEFPGHPTTHIISGGNVPTDNPADTWSGKYTKNTEFSGWFEDPANDHDPNNREAFYNAFVAHCEGNDRKKPGTYGIKRVLAGGYPQELLPHNVTSNYETLTAQTLGVPVFRVRAVHHAESTGQPFGGPGKATIRFEAHEWLRNIPKDKEEWAFQNFRVDNGVEMVLTAVGDDMKWLPLQDKRQEDRWNDLMVAVAIERELAFKWTSMGLFQLLGLHAPQLGYGSAEEMLKDFSKSDDAEGAQWRGFENFIQSNQELHQAFIRGDVETFARIYNGNPKVYKPILIRDGWFGYQ